MSVSNCDYTDFFYAMFENSKQEHSQLKVSFNVDKQRVYKLARKNVFLIFMYSPNKCCGHTTEIMVNIKD